MNRTELIQKILNENLNLCQNNTEFNDSMLYDLLMYGFKGLEKMTIEELNTELENLTWVTLLILMTLTKISLDSMSMTC